MSYNNDLYCYDISGTPQRDRLSVNSSVFVGFLFDELYKHSLRRVEYHGNGEAYYSPAISHIFGSRFT